MMNTIRYMKHKGSYFFLFLCFLFFLSFLFFRMCEVKAQTTIPPSPTLSATSSQNCSKSDNGDIYTRGHLKSDVAGVCKPDVNMCLNDIYDFCVTKYSGYNLIEYTCGAASPYAKSSGYTNSVFENAIDCPNGCLDGSCIQFAASTPTPSLVESTIIPIPSKQPSPSCGLACLNGMQCYQPPMPPCPSGLNCMQVMPAPICVTPTVLPSGCSLRSQGDVNCDSLVNTVDLDSIKLKLRGLPYPSDCTKNCSADLNGDGKVDLVDFEIWRNSALRN